MKYYVVNKVTREFAEVEMTHLTIHIMNAFKKYGWARNHNFGIENCAYSLITRGYIWRQ